MDEKQYPKIVLGALLCNSKGEIFLGHGPKWGDLWVVPGGHLEWGETLEHGLRREIKEETNLDIRDIEFLGIQESILSPEYYSPKHMIFLDYTAQVTSENVILNSEMDKFVWINPKRALSDLVLGTSVRNFIQNFLKRKDIIV